MRRMWEQLLLLQAVYLHLKVKGEYMSYPNGAGTITNNYGPALPNSATQSPPYGAPGVAANVAQIVPAPATYNFTNSETSNQNYVAAMTVAGNVQTPWNTPFGNSDAPSPPGKNVAQTTPSAPSGTFVQSGSNYVTNASQVILAGLSSQGFTYYRGV
jgi:hypothetical protein